MKYPRLIRAADVRRLGQDPATLARWCRQGELERVYHGSYVTAVEWQQLSRVEQYGLGVSAFNEAVTRPAVLCHASAALLWGLWIVGVPGRTHVVTETRTSGRSTKNIARHVGSLSESIVRCGPFLLTDKLRTTMALISELAFPYAVAICDSALRQPVARQQVNAFRPIGTLPGAEEPSWTTDGPQGPALSVDELRLAAAKLPTRAARNRVNAVINFASGLSGSAGESISRAKMYELGFPAPVLQKEFTLLTGKSANVDFWFEEQNVAGEFDGKGKYLRGDWSGGSMEERVWAEKCREDDIRSQGVRFVRWTWRDMSDRGTFAALLRRAGLPQR